MRGRKVEFIFGRRNLNLWQQKIRKRGKGNGAAGSGRLEIGFRAVTFFGKAAFRHSEKAVDSRRRARSRRRGRKENRGGTALRGRAGTRRKSGGRTGGCGKRARGSRTRGGGSCRGEGAKRGGRSGESRKQTDGNACAGKGTRGGIRACRGEETCGKRIRSGNNGGRKKDGYRERGAVGCRKRRKNARYGGKSTVCGKSGGKRTRRRIESGRA